MRGLLRWRIVQDSRLNKGGAEALRALSQGAWGAFWSPAALLIGVALWLLGLHLEPHAVDLLCFNAQALKQLFARLLVATKSAESGPIGMLLAAVDAESHGCPSN